MEISVPEFKIMLEVYLATPVVENDRREMNTFNGRQTERQFNHTGLIQENFLDV